MTDQTTGPATWDVTASVTVTSPYAASYAHAELAGAVDRTAAKVEVTDTAIEAHRRDPAPTPTAADVPDGLSYADVIAQKVANELDRREQTACDQAAAEFDTVWDSVGGRPVEVAGSPENLAALDRLLTGWRCCTAPASCGARCQDDELSDVLARAARLVSERTATLAPAEETGTGSTRARRREWTPGHHAPDGPAASEEQASA